MAVVIALYGLTAGGTENALASIDVPTDGTILGVDWDVNGILNADGESMGFELSFLSTNQLTSNDARGRVSSCSEKASFVTAASGIRSSIQKFVPTELPVSGGERLYLHAVCATGVVATVRANVLFDLPGFGELAGARPRIRRR